MTGKNPIENQFDKTYWILFAFILVLVFLAAIIGWTSETLYHNNPSDLIIKLRYYDVSLLTIATPVSLVSLLLLIKNNKKAIMFSLGLTIYLIFSFAVTIFTAAQNSLFLIYIAIISVCTFYFTKGFFQTYTASSLRIDKTISKIVAVVLLFSAISGFGFLLSDAINFLLAHPEEINDLRVNAPQVLDMAIILPFTTYGAIRLWRNKKDGFLISLLAMIFFIFIGISVVMMEFGLVANTSIEIDYGKVYSFSFISMINVVTAILAYRKLKIEQL